MCDGVFFAGSPYSLNTDCSAPSFHQYQDLITDAEKEILQCDLLLSACNKCGCNTDHWWPRARKVLRCRERQRGGDPAIRHLRPGNDDLSPHWPGTHTLDSGRVSPGHSSSVSHKQEHWDGIKCNETMDKNWSLLPWYSATRESLLPGGNWTLRIVEILCNW